ncbi:MAG: hypothetical protein ACRDTU_03400 [Micromonosporaceae bacterium]
MAAFQGAPVVPTGRRLSGAGIASVVIGVVAHFLATVSMFLPWATWSVHKVDHVFGVTLFSWRMGGWAAGYLIGLVVLEVLLAMALVGPDSLRQAARIAGIGVALLAFGMVFGAAADTTYLAQMEERQIPSGDPGAGLWCGMLAVLMLGVAAGLARRPSQAR